jgi:hypothetical protein
MNTSLSIFAKALASENISFSFSKDAETASFDVKSRHLVMPMWDVSETVKTMLVAHEISHALWTPYERGYELLKAAEADGYNPMLLSRIANIIEDVRIEKLMKQKFPGTRRDFFLGYKEIADIDMFGFKKMDFTKAGFLNRLNIHFKWGVPGFIPMTFEGTEQEVVDMVDAVVNYDQVFEVAKFLYKHPSMKEMREDMEAAAAKGGKQGEKEQDKIMGDKTNVPGDFRRKDGSQYQDAVVTLTGVKDLSKHIVSTETILNDYEGNSNRPLLLEEYRQFVRESDAFVRQMVAQFERKKAADEIRRERPKQTGMLNLDRLHQYRTHDDIFLSKIVKQDGKNHGIVFMLDFSGSMDSHLKACFLQTLQLIWFCEKAKIPFEVFGFTEIHRTQYDVDFRRAYENHVRKYGTTDGFDLSDGHILRECPNAMMIGATKLINLCSSTDKPEDRERTLAFLHGAIVGHTHSRGEALRLGGTPTVEAVAIVSEFMKDWVTANNIQIPTLMVVTDGQPNGIDIMPSPNKESNLYRYCPQYSLTVMNEIMGTGIRIEQKKYGRVCLPNIILATMYDSLRVRLNAKIVGMFVGGYSFTESVFASLCMSEQEQQEFYEANRNNTPKNLRDCPRFNAAQEAYKDGAMLCHPEANPGYDAFFITKNPKIVKDEDAIVEEGTFTKVKNTFIKTMGKRGSSRVFLTRYVDIVAGQNISKMVDSMYGLPV